MSGFDSILFAASSVIVLTASLFLLAVNVAGVAIGWTGGLGLPFSNGGRIFAIGVLALSFAAFAIPAALVRYRFQHRKAQPWVVIVSTILIVAACGIGAASLLLDPGDFFWFGAPIILFAGGLATMTITLRRSF